jgi:hypothetical protein
VRDPPSKYGFPPLRDTTLPDSVPWNTPISELSGLWLLKDCPDCGEAKVPLRKIAADRGWKLTLRTIVPRLRCGQCGNPLRSARLTDDAAGTDGRHGARPRYLDLPLR